MPETWCVTYTLAIIIATTITNISEFILKKWYMVLRDSIGGLSRTCLLLPQGQRHPASR